MSRAESIVRQYGEIDGGGRFARIEFGLESGAVCGFLKSEDFLMPKKTKTYRHGEKALLRPEAGAQERFVNARAKKPPREYRYDSSLAPELIWDESEARAECESLFARVLEPRSESDARAAVERLRAIFRPALNWAGKAERGAFAVETMPLFVHERLSTKAILETLKLHRRDSSRLLDLFGESERSAADKILGAYEHRNGWQNRLILGDALSVMNSLLQYESQGGAAQMVYMDPPYGIKFGGNFQPFVRKRDVKDGDDKNMTREPEMVKAYRDTWQLGVHSWLTYMRDRLLLARELLADSGSCFVQISDENAHLVRCVMDEVFGAENFVGYIAYKTTSGTPQKKSVRRVNDFIIWYAKTKEAMKFNRLFQRQEIDTRMFNRVEDAEGERRAMTREEKANPAILSAGLRPFRTLPLHSMSGNDRTPREFAGRKWTIPSGGWRFSLDGFNRLAQKGRIIEGKTVIGTVYYHDDFPYSELPSMWVDTGPELAKNYVVQTNPQNYRALHVDDDRSGRSRHRPDLRQRHNGFCRRKMGTPLDNLRHFAGAARARAAAFADREIQPLLSERRKPRTLRRLCLCAQTTQRKRSRRHRPEYHFGIDRQRRAAAERSFGRQARKRIGRGARLRPVLRRGGFAAGRLARIRFA